jgi:hypothetical protein
MMKINERQDLFVKTPIRLAEGSGGHNSTDLANVALRPNFADNKKYAGTGNICSVQKILCSPLPRRTKNVARDLERLPLLDLDETVARRSKRPDSEARLQPQVLIDVQMLWAPTLPTMP